MLERLVLLVMGLQTALVETLYVLAWPKAHERHSPAELKQVQAQAQAQAVTPTTPT